VSRGSRGPSTRDPDAISRALARLYDLDLLDDPGDLEMYLDLAARTRGSILELAAGTGRIAVPLAIAGHDVTAVDIDPAMLERAVARADAAHPRLAGRLELVEADLVDLDLPEAGTFGLAFIALNSFFLLATPAAQRQAFATMARHLAPEGLAVVDVWLPDAGDLAGFDGRLVLEYERTEPEAGDVVTKMASARFDPQTSIVDLTAIYEEGRPGEAVLRWTRHDALRLVAADELAGMAEAAGFRVEQIAGEYDLGPPDAETDRAILVARRL
jgi:SAM-dependent methyltransferase